MLRQTRQERRRGIGPAVAEHLNIKHQHRIEIDRGVTPPPLRADLNRRLVDGDPPRSAPRRVILIVCEAVRPVPDRSMRAITVEEIENRYGLTQRESRRMEADGERPLVIQRSYEDYRNFYGKLDSSTSSSRSAST